MLFVIQIIMLDILENHADISDMVTSVTSVIKRHQALSYEGNREFSCIRRPDRDYLAILGRGLRAFPIGKQNLGNFQNIQSLWYFSS